MSYYSRKGKPISFDQWAQSRENKRVAEDYVEGKWVSTVHLGINLGLNWTEGPPLIFETMVFPCKSGEGNVDDWNEEFCQRYSTEELALRGHQDIVRQIKEGRWREGLDLDG